MSAPDRRAHARPRHPRLSIRRQCALLGLARSGVYRLPRPANDDDLALMRRIDELFTALAVPGLAADGGDAAGRRARDQPQAGAAADAADGDRGAGAEAADDASRRRGTRSIRICCATWRSTGRTRSGRPTSPTSRSGAASSTWSRSWTGRAGRCWRGGCRTRWTWRSASSALEEALARFGTAGDLQHRPGQPVHQRRLHRPCWRRPASASRWTAAAAGWTTCSSSGCGASLKYEDVYLKGYADGREARAGIAAWIAFYNHRRPHQALGEPHADGGLAGRRHRRARRQGCGYDAALGQRWRVAHMPTAASNSRQLEFHDGQSGAASTLSPGPSGPDKGVHLTPCLMLTT